MKKYYITLAVLLAGVAPYALNHVVTPAYAQSEEGNPIEEEETDEERAAREAEEAAAEEEADRVRNEEYKPVAAGHLSRGMQAINGTTGAPAGPQGSSDMERAINSAIDGADSLPEAGRAGKAAAEGYTKP